MKHVIIATTALNRPDLHKTVFPNWYKQILTLDCKITHFINIDCIDKLNFTYEETIKNFKEMHNKYDINLQILPEKKPNFFISCLNISKQIDIYIRKNEIEKEDVCIFWLEDDWILTREINFKPYLPFFNMNSKIAFESHRNYSIILKNYIWALMPSILGYNIFKEMLDIWSRHYIMNDMRDPEHLIGCAFIKKDWKRKNQSFLFIDDTLEKLHLNDYFFSNYIAISHRGGGRYIIDINNILTNYKDKILKRVPRRHENKINILIAANASKDVGRNYMESLNIKKKKVKNNQFKYIKID